MPETTADKAQVVAEHLRSCVDNLIIQVDHKIIRAKISIGVAGYDPTDETMDKKRLILMADKAQARAKNSGKNRISLYTPTAMTETND
jgi:diguanylate cyclase (GGDEF)-like protein